jgi:hypothetical protein
MRMGYSPSLRFLLVLSYSSRTKRGSRPRASVLAFPEHCIDALLTFPEWDDANSVKFRCT